MAMAQQPVVDDRDASFMPPPVAEPVLPSTAPTTAALAPVAVAPVPTTDTSPPSAAPVDLGKPVATETLAAVDPDTVGSLTATNGGLGASMWKETPRVLVDRLMPSLNLPAASPALNNLARRLLLSTAALPVGESSLKRNLTTLRIEKLMALGDVSSAWQLTLLAKPDRIDETTMRLLTEAALIGPDSKAVCDRIPSIMAGHSGAEWQKAQILCQLRGGDIKAAQLGLDLMREQQVKDDIYNSLVGHNILGGSKQLPRQLTPMRPLTMALLRQTDLPLPAELYRRPDAVMVSEILAAKAADENARLGLAERSAARGLISAAQLIAVYRDVVTTPEILSHAIASSEVGPKLHAVLYQAASQEKAPQKRIDLIIRLVQSFDPIDLHGAAGQVVAELINDIGVATDYNTFAPMAVNLYTLAGKPDQAMNWLKLARGPASRLPNVAAQLDAIWPTLVLSGLVTDTEYGAGMNLWLDFILKEPVLPTGATPEQMAKNDKVMHTRRQQVGSVLLLFVAAGYAVPEEAWARVTDLAPEGKKTIVPSAVLIERLQDAGTFNRKGEAALLTLLLAGSGDAPLFVITDAIKSLRQVGLLGDAQALARETATTLLSPPVTP